ncbi:MAG TPA: ABC transporter permease [Acidimicrobiales bacterium]|jgi:peptide/nickel transport system permease protein
MTFLLRRLGFYLLTAWIAITINFFLPRLMPGNPLDLILTRYRSVATPNQVHALETTFGLDTNQGLVGQYFHYLNQLLHGNLGISITYFPEKVSSVIAHALPWTILLVGTATVIAFIGGTLIGIVVAWRRGTWTDGVLPVTTFFSAVPYFWMALLILSIFAVSLHWFPVSGGYSNTTTPGWNLPFILSALYHGILPAVTIIISSIAGWILGMRNMMVMTLDEEYVQLAQAKGLSNRRVMYTYAARNAILPNLAGFALALGFVVAGSIVTEIVFSYPGIGFILFSAIGNEDFPLMQGVFLVITFTVLVANLVADFCYVLLDPRTNQAG